MPNLTLNYSQKDLTDVLTLLASQISTFSNGTWTSFLATDAGTALVDALAQLNDFNQFFVDSQVQETMLSTCQLRESGVRIAEELGYPIREAVAATVTAQITLPPQSSGYSIAANSQWSITNLPFTCLDPLSISSGQSSITISLVQGTPYTTTTTAPGTPWYSITIPNNITNIVVTVNSTVWTSTDTWTVVTTPTTYKTYESPAGRIISFGIAGIDRQIPQNGDAITITGITTLGNAGNIQTTVNNVIPVSAIRNASSVLLNNSINGVTLGAALGGQDPETLLSIQENAPAFYGTQGRIVTLTDYEAVVKQQSGITDSIVVGGESNEVMGLGTVQVVIFGTDPYNVSGSLINEVTNALTNLNVVTVTPIVSGPAIIECAMTINAGISSLSFTDSAAAQTAIINAVTNYFNPPSQGGVLGIGKPLYHSALDAILQAIPGIIYTDTTYITDSFTTSTAGKISIQLPLNADLISATLVGASAGTLLSGNLSSHVGTVLNKSYFTYIDSGLSNQVCTLTYGVTNNDVITSYNQKLINTSLTVNVSFVS